MFECKINSVHSENDTKGHILKPHGYMRISDIFSFPGTQSSKVAEDWTKTATIALRELAEVVPRFPPGNF